MRSPAVARGGLIWHSEGRRMLVQLRTRAEDIPGAVGPEEASVRALERGAFAGGALLDRLDRQVRYVRLSLTDRCNLRCTYCMPEGGVDHVAREALLTFEEIERLARVLARLEPVWQGQVELQATGRLVPSESI